MQRVIAGEEDGNLVIRGLLIEDFPVILRLMSTKSVYLPMGLKG